MDPHLNAVLKQVRSIIFFLAGLTIACVGVSMGLYSMALQHWGVEGNAIVVDRGFKLLALQADIHGENFLFYEQIGFSLTGLAPGDRVPILCFASECKLTTAVGTLNFLYPPSVLAVAFGSLFMFVSIATWVPTPDLD